MTLAEHFIAQQSYFTYQRKGNQELRIQLLDDVVAGLHNQIINFTPSPPPDNNDPEIGTMPIQSIIIICCTIPKPTLHTNV